ncbi:hypothetical protein AB1Y20_021497 [Prymnesium parvum]|uniref:Calmodulin-lysine N-methyltransferase n=1 Tax=Prymnesium parvum TaxID=97485 RepID=A0AB34JKA5_PRYPA
MADWEVDPSRGADSDECNMLGGWLGPLPRLPSGASLQITCAPALGSTGGVLWPSAPALCERLLALLDDEHASPSDADAIELGAGTGCVGLFAAALGARVVLTDGGFPSGSEQAVRQLEHLRANVRLNAGVLAGGVRVMELDWSVPEHCDAVLASGPAHKFDLVLGSDITFEHSMHPAIASAIARLLRPRHGGGQGGTALISYTTRHLNAKGRDVDIVRFMAHASAKGLRVISPPLETTFQGHVGICILRHAIPADELGYKGSEDDPDIFDLLR